MKVIEDFKKEEADKGSIEAFIIEEPLSAGYNYNIKYSELHIDMVLKDCRTGDYEMRFTISDIRIKDYSKDKKIVALSIEVENLYYEEKDFTFCHTWSYDEVFNIRIKRGGGKPLRL